MCLSIIHLSLSCNHLFISVLSCLSCCTCYLCISISINIYLCHCVSVYCLSLSLSFIYLISIYILFIFSCPSLCLTPSPYAYHSHSIFISLIPVISYFMVSFCPFISFQGLSIFFFLFPCITLSNLISSSLILLICLPPSFLTPKISVPKNHVQKTCMWDQVWLERTLNERASRLGVGTHNQLYVQQPTLCWNPRQTLDSCNKGAFLDLLLSFLLPNWASQRKGRSWLVSRDFRGEAPGSAAC